MGTIDLRGDGVNTEMETGSRSTAAPIVAHRASLERKIPRNPVDGGQPGHPSIRLDCGAASLRSTAPQSNYTTTTGHFICYRKRTSSLATDKQIFPESRSCCASGLYLPRRGATLQQRLTNGKARVGQNHLLTDHFLMVDQQGRLEVTGALLGCRAQDDRDEGQPVVRVRDADRLPFP